MARIQLQELESGPIETSDHFALILKPNPQILNAFKKAILKSDWMAPSAILG